MSNSPRRRAVRAAAAVLVLTGFSGLGAAETKRPPAPALIAGAKATPLAPFQVKDEIKDLTVEAWLKQRVGAKGRIGWRATSCHAKVGDRDIYNSPICVEATIRYAKGFTITVGIGFDARAPRPERKPDAMWGSLAVRGKGCEFFRHPDYIDAALTTMDETIKSGSC